VRPILDPMQSAKHTNLLSVSGIHPLQSIRARKAEARDFHKLKLACRTIITFPQLHELYFSIGRDERALGKPCLLKSARGRDRVASSRGKGADANSIPKITRGSDPAAPTANAQET